MNGLLLMCNQSDSVVDGTLCERHSDKVARELYRQPDRKILNVSPDNRPGR